MRTREKFYENLNKKHVSLEKRVERFEFQDVKTLDSMASKAASLHAKMKKAHDKWIDLDIKKDDLDEAWKKTKEISDAGIDKIQSVKKENEKRLEVAVKNSEKLWKKYSAAYKKYEKAKDISDKEASAGRQVKSEVESFVDKMETAIKNFERSAKALGVDVSSKVEKYKTAMRRAHASSMVKFGE